VQQAPALCSKGWQCRVDSRRRRLNRDLFHQFSWSVSKLVGRQNAQILPVLCVIKRRETSVTFVCVCGQIVPDASAERCRVVLDSCKFNEKYKIVVAALTGGNCTVFLHRTYVICLSARFLTAAFFSMWDQLSVIVGN